MTYIKYYTFVIENFIPSQGGPKMRALVNILKFTKSNIGILLGQLALGIADLNESGLRIVSGHRLVKAKVPVIRSSRKRL